MLNLYTIPFGDKFIIYRPLMKLAFVGNQAMADIAKEIARGNNALNLSDETRVYLETIGFFEPDPPAPSLPQHSFTPVTAVLFLTNRCNLRCTYCYASGGDKTARELDPGITRQAIDYVSENARRLERPHFNLTFHGGGEPVQAWEALKIATAYARSKDVVCHVSMVSNGVWSRAQLDWIINNLDGLTLSFDGAQSTQDTNRPLASGQGTFDLVMQSIRALDAAHFPYGIRMTALAPWRERLVEDVRFICEETKCQSMQVEPAFNTARGQHQGPKRLEAQAFVDAYLEAWHLAHEAGRQFTYSGARPRLITQSFCSAPYNALIVTPDQQLVTCYEITDETHPLAALSTIGYIDADGINVDLSARDTLLAHIESKLPACKECFAYWHCAGDCYTRSYYAQQFADGENNTRCYINQQITANLILWQVMQGDGVWRGYQQSGA